MMTEDKLPRKVPKRAQEKCMMAEKKMGNDETITT
jgi:hypothetical protein